MSEIYFSVEGRPQAWQRAGINGKTFFTKPATRLWQKTVAIEARKAIGRTPPNDGAVFLEVHFYQEIPKSWPAAKKALAKNGQIWPTGKPDLSNLLKSIEDACNGILFNDDSQVVNFVALKAYGEKFLTVVRCGKILALSNDESSGRGIDRDCGD